MVAIANKKVRHEDVCLALNSGTYKVRHAVLENAILHTFSIMDKEANEVIIAATATPTGGEKEIWRSSVESYNPRVMHKLLSRIWDLMYTTN